MGRRAVNQPDTHFVFLALHINAIRRPNRPGEQATESERDSDRDRDHRTKLRGIYEGGTTIQYVIKLAGRVAFPWAAEGAASSSAINKQ